MDNVTLDEVKKEVVITRASTWEERKSKLNLLQEEENILRQIEECNKNLSKVREYLALFL